MSHPNIEEMKAHLVEHLRAMDARLAIDGHVLVDHRGDAAACSPECFQAFLTQANAREGEGDAAYWARQWYTEHREVARLRDAQVASLGRDLDAYLPVLRALGDEQISTRKALACLGEWLTGTDFREPANRPWERDVHAR